MWQIEVHTCNVFICPASLCLLVGEFNLFTLKVIMDTHDPIAVVQSLSCVQLLATPWTVACQAPCPSPSPRVRSNSCPLSLDMPNLEMPSNPISSSVVPVSSCPQSFPASGSFPMSQYFNHVAKVLEFQLQHQSFQ